MALPSSLLISKNVPIQQPANPKTLNPEMEVTTSTPMKPFPKTNATLSKIHRTQQQTLPLINTPLQRGARLWLLSDNRFNGFSRLQETVETVRRAMKHTNTLRKQDVNESPDNSRAPRLQNLAFALNLIALLFCGGCKDKHAAK